MPRKYFEDLDNCCSEKMVIAAARRVLNKTFKFKEYESENNIFEGQIDLSNLFILGTPDSNEDHKLFYSGWSRKLFLKDINTLDNKQCYFLRTGTGGAGHWQLLYANKNEHTKKYEWFIDSGSFIWKITDGNQITTDGENTLMAFRGKDGEGTEVARQMWGVGKDQYRFYLIPVNEEVIYKTAVFIKAYRELGEDFGERIFEINENTKEAFENCVEIENFQAIERETPRKNINEILIDIINAIILNITLKRNGRCSFYNNGIEKKRGRLEAIIEQIENNSFSNHEIIEKIREVCLVKRNQWSIFTPHSVNEFELLLKEHNIDPLSLLNESSMSKI